MSLPIRARLTLQYGSVLAATIVALSAFLILQLQHDLRDALDEEIRLGSVELVRALRDETPASAPQQTPGSDDQEPGDTVDDFRDAARAILSPRASGAQLIDSAGRVLVRYGAVAGDAPLAGASLRGAAFDEGPITVTQTHAGQRYRTRLTSVQVSGEERVLVLTESLRPVEKAVGRVIGLIFLALPAAVVLTSMLAYWLASRALRPVDRMTGDAEAIGIADLHERIEVPTSQDETRRLAVTLNAMLERIETGVRDKRRLVADASHELRTPLATMRSELDLALRNRDVTEAQREALLSVRDEVDGVARIVDNIVTLAQADEGRLELLTTTVDVGEVLQDVTTRLQPLAEGKDVALTVLRGSWRAQADGARLRLLVTNLVENAIKFSPQGGSVQVRTWRTGAEVGLSVTDEAPEIRPEDRDQVFERFYRAPEMRARGVVGGGLGLAICKEIAVAHGGRIWLEPGPGRGNSFSVALPAWRADEEARGTGPGPGSATGLAEPPRVF